jgi:hypothetical protein
MDEDDFEVLDDTVYKSFPISRHRMESFLVRIDEIGRDGEILSSTRRFEGIDSSEDVVKIIEDHKRLRAENEELKAALEEMAGKRDWYKEAYETVTGGTNPL